MITEDKVIEIFCIMDEFCNNFASEWKNLRLEDKEHPHCNRKGRLSFSEIMTILVCYHFGSFKAISRQIFTSGADCYVSLRMTTLVRLDSKYAPF